MAEIYGLARVSTEEQNEARQVMRFIKLGIPKKNIVIEKESGKSTVRITYQDLVKHLKWGDILYIENIDRLARDYDNILDQWHILTIQKGITIKVLDTPMLDTDQKANDLLSKFVRNILLHIYAFLSELEWHKIKSRQAQGIAIAKAEGKNLGRPKAKRTKFEKKVIKQYQNKEINFDTALKMLDMSKSTFYNLYNIVKNE